MKFSESEKEKLLVFCAAQLAMERRRRNLKLNYPEAWALITYRCMEMARLGMGAAIVSHAGKTILYREDVMKGVPEMLDKIVIEATFEDGVHLVTIDAPITYDGVAPRD